MVTRYRKLENLYSFYLTESANGWNDYIIIVKTPNNEQEPETIKHIPVKELNGYAIKINKKSISANNGARGAFGFIRDCIRNDFMMVYVNKIIEQFMN